MKINLFKIIILLCFLPVCISAQTGLDYLEINPDARGLSLSGADIAEGQTINGIHYNPALLLKVNEQSFSYSHLKWLAGFKQDNLGFGKKLLFGHMGLSVCYGYNYSIFKTDDLGNELGGLDCSSLLVKAVYARSISVFRSNLNFGLDVNLFQSVLDEYKASAYFINFGMILPELIMQDLRLAFTGENFGTPLKYDQESVNLPMVLNLGLSYIMLKNSNDRFNIYAKCHYKLNEYFSFPLGAEYQLFEILFLRLGYLIDNYSIQNFTGGLGILYKNFFADFALLPDMVSSIYAISIGYGW